MAVTDAPLRLGAPAVEQLELLDAQPQLKAAGGVVCAKAAWGASPGLAHVARRAHEAPHRHVAQRPPGKTSPGKGGWGRRTHRWSRDPEGRGGAKLEIGIEIRGPRHAACHKRPRGIVLAVGDAQCPEGGRRGGAELARARALWR